MTEFEMLLACYRSGQISERQWQEHLRDREFREWVMQKKDRRVQFSCCNLPQNVYIKRHRETEQANPQETDKMTKTQIQTQIENLKIAFTSEELEFLFWAGEHKTTEELMNLIQGLAALKQGK